MKNSMVDVLIIGAGPTGLTMANVLARNGVRVRIVDKKAGPVEETRAIVVHAKTLELLNRLGLAGQAANTGQHLRALQLLKEGKTADKVSFIEGDGLTPYPFALIYAQDQIEHLLIESLNQHGLQVEWNTELLSLEQTATNTSARIRHADDKEETVEAGWTIGADGAHSPVRHMLGLGFTGESYKQALFLADVDLEGGLDRGEAAINFAPLGFFGFFPMAGGEQRFRIVGALPPELRERDNLTIAETQQVLDTYEGPPLKITAAR